MVLKGTSTRPSPAPGLLDRPRGRWLYDGRKPAVDDGIAIGRGIAISVSSVLHEVKVSDALASGRHVDRLGQRDRILHRELDLHLIVIHHADALDRVQALLNGSTATNTNGMDP